MNLLIAQMSATYTLALESSSSKRVQDLYALRRDAPYLCITGAMHLVVMHPTCVLLAVNVSAVQASY
jgi:hypothetical protein